MTYSKKGSRESRAAIERIYISMRHLITRGAYKPMGLSGQALVKSLMDLQPEIYGSMADPERVELDGLLYVTERLPKGIEECRIIHLVAREGLEESGHQAIVPLKRRRNCYRIDSERMYVEMTRGRSDIYDILTHLTFLYIEAAKIMRHALENKKLSGDWKHIEKIVLNVDEEHEIESKRALVYLSNILGRTVAETKDAVEKFEKSSGNNSLYHLVYWLGKVAIEESINEQKKEIIFSAELRNVIGHHIYAESWANHIKLALLKHKWEKRPLHIISANLHSFVNLIYGCGALKDKSFNSIMELADYTSKHPDSMKAIKSYANKHGLFELDDSSGTNLGVQFIDLAKVDLKELPIDLKITSEETPILLIMDYAFGEQAYECMDELLKSYEGENEKLGFSLNVKSVSVMGKAGILKGKKGDIMIPTAHVFEGTGDNYPLQNELNSQDFVDVGIPVFEGTMITVLGTSLQNKDVLHHFTESTWRSVGLEMEGAHYQKAIQSASRIRKSVSENVKTAYAYYASDNPLATGSTLSSGSLGVEGIKPTYWISIKILQKVL
tara:strand:- start:109316 stop:110977 length:1662 start_codon:yes stop_codon:yes gene_type:complete